MWFDFASLFTVTIIDSSGVKGIRPGKKKK
jgi:hypothetical protein